MDPEGTKGGLIWPTFGLSRGSNSSSSRSSKEEEVVQNVSGEVHEEEEEGKSSPEFLRFNNLFWRELLVQCVQLNRYIVSYANVKPRILVERE